MLWVKASVVPKSCTGCCEAIIDSQSVIHHTLADTLSSAVGGMAWLSQASPMPNTQADKLITAQKIKASSIFWLLALDSWLVVIIASGISLVR